LGLGIIGGYLRGIGFGKEDIWIPALGCERDGFGFPESVLLLGCWLVNGEPISGAMYWCK
jgi:hypothetical protein